jgi:alpha-glucosidase
VTLATHTAVGAPPTWVIGNHDLPRPVYRYGRDPRGWDTPAWSRRPAADQVQGLRRARAAALLSLALPGSAYVYQGDELGLPEVLDLPDAVREDPTFRRTGGSEPGRDGCRIPIPWSGETPPYGFGPDGSRPWLPQPAGWASWSVAAEDGDPASVLSLYRAALAIRRAHSGLAGASFRWAPAAGGVLRFARDATFECVVNLSAEPVALPPGARLLLASIPLVDGRLPPDGAAWLVTGD